jgi:hypothetical protein
MITFNPNGKVRRSRPKIILSFNINEQRIILINCYEKRWVLFSFSFDILIKILSQGVTCNVKYLL